MHRQFIRIFSSNYTRRAETGLSKVEQRADRNVVQSNPVNKTRRGAQKMSLLSGFNLGPVYMEVGDPK